MILFTGSTGFVGASLLNYFGPANTIAHKRGDSLNFISAPIFIHLAGKSCDKKKVLNPQVYYEVNTDFTKKVFDAFLNSDAKVFITLSSVKAVADEINEVLTEETIANPVSFYGKSKLFAEQYILSKKIPLGKRVYILRPCMIHGPGNKGNLNLLFKLVSKGLPWPLGAFENKRSFCSIDNLLFVFKELVERDDIPTGVYNIADDEPLSTNELIELISNIQGKKPKIWNISKRLITFIVKIGDKLNLSLNSENLHKLTDSYVVSSAKLKSALGKNLPVSSRDGLIKTLNSFNS